MLRIKEMVWNRQQFAQGWVRALLAYARQHGGQLPASFSDAESYWPQGFVKGTVVPSEQFELLYHGSLESLTNQEAILFRERNPWPYGNEAYGTGKFGRMYALADGHIQYCSSSDKTAQGNYDAFERSRMPPETSP
jgi:hypothetical protein